MKFYWHSVLLWSTKFYCHSLLVLSTKFYWHALLLSIKFNWYSAYFVNKVSLAHSTCFANKVLLALCLFVNKVLLAQLPLLAGGSLPSLQGGAVDTWPVGLEIIISTSRHRGGLRGSRQREGQTQICLPCQKRHRDSGEMSGHREGQKLPLRKAEEPSAQSKGTKSPRGQGHGWARDTEGRQPAPELGSARVG